MVTGSSVLKVWPIVVAFWLTACGGDGSTPPGTAGASAGSGGAPASAGTGSGAIGGAGTGGASGGSAGVPPCPTGLMAYGPSDIDLTLGGLNADLPPPSKDCLTVAPDTSMCAALTVEVKGVQRDVVCTQPTSSAHDGSSLYCTNGTEDVGVVTRDFGGTTPPGTFALGVDTLPNPLELILPEGRLGTSDSTPATAAQVNGWVNRFFDKYNGCVNAMYGVVAVTLPDTGSGVVRARGSFQSRQFFQ